MLERYFLGANSGEGFFSLYGQFPGEGLYLHVIKGGPGSGKSSLMNRIAEGAESRGYAVQRLLCSGDPQSLDGIAIPGLGQAWCDGTAPHVMEPGIFGVNGDYVDLSRFFRGPLSRKDSKELQELNKAYKEQYKLAYAALHRAEKDAGDRVAKLEPEQEQELRSAVEGLLERHEPIACPLGNRPERVFLSAISCDGMIWLRESLCGGAEHIYSLERESGIGRAALEAALRIARERGERPVEVADPLSPGCMNAVILPERSLVLADGCWELDRGEELSLMAMPAAEIRSAPEGWLDKGLEHLAAAKLLHDRLESVYRPYMDIPALEAFTQEQLKRIFA